MSTEREIIMFLFIEYLISNEIQIPNSKQNQKLCSVLDNKPIIANLTLISIIINQFLVSTQSLTNNKWLHFNLFF